MYLTHIDKITIFIHDGRLQSSAATNRYEIPILWTLKKKYKNLVDYLKPWSTVVDNREQYLKFHINLYFW